jgi:hypothetical protein
MMKFAPKKNKKLSYVVHVANPEKIVGGTPPTPCPQPPPPLQKKSTNVQTQRRLKESPRNFLKQSKKVQNKMLFHPLF